MKPNPSGSIFALFLLLFPVAGAFEGRQSQKQSLELLAQNLHSSDATVQAQATTKLINAGPASIPVLLPILCDKSNAGADDAWKSAALALGELKAEAAIPCLVRTLGAGSLAGSVFKSTATISEREPSFVALIKIGKPVVPVIARYLPILHPDSAYLALRVLREINTPAAKSSTEDYIKLLENQTRLAKDILADFK